jgi:hypothetical protein
LRFFGWERGLGRARVPVFFLSLNLPSHTPLFSSFSHLHSLPAAAYRGAYDLRGAGDDPATLDALTGGAWSGGREFEVLNLPAGVYGAGDELSDEKVRLGYEVRASYPGGGAASAAAAADAAALEALRVAEEEGDGEAEEEGHGRVLEVGWTPFDGAAGSV